MNNRRLVMLLHLTVVLLSWAVIQAESKISLLNSCDTEIQLTDDTKQSVAIQGSEWSSSRTKICMLTFRSPEKFNLIYFEFESFSVNDQDIKIILESSSARGRSYNPEGTYSMSSPPTLYTPDTTERLFQITVKRDHHASYDFDVVIDVFTEEYYHSHISPEKEHNLKVGEIAGIVIGSIVFIIVLITVAICCVIGMKYPTRRGSIYNMARRVSIFATTTGSEPAKTEGSDTESDLKTGVKKGSKGRTNQAYSGGLGNPI